MCCKIYPRDGLCRKVHDEPETAARCAQGTAAGEGATVPKYAGTSPWQTKQQRRETAIRPFIAVCWLIWLCKTSSLRHRTVIIACCSAERCLIRGKERFCSISCRCSATKPPHPKCFSIRRNRCCNYRVSATVRGQAGLLSQKGGSDPRAVRSSTS